MATCRSSGHPSNSCEPWTVPASQSELLKELLPAISEHAARAVVLVLRDGKVSAWSGIGFADGEALRSWQGDAAESAALVKLLEVSQPVRFAPEEDGLFSGWLTDEEKPAAILLIPVVLRGKLMGTVYVDRLEDQPWNPETAQTLVAQVCWLIDTLQYRTAAAPSLAEPVAIGEIIDATEPEKQQTEEEPPADEKTAPEGELNPQARRPQKRSRSTSRRGKRTPPRTPSRREMSRENPSKASWTWIPRQP